MEEKIRMKKGISIALSTLIVLIALVVTLIIFATFMAKGVYREKSITQKPISEIEIPCYKAPTIQLVEDVESAIFINASKTYIDLDRLKNLWTQGEIVTPVQLNATISSTCLENLTIIWNFGDGSSLETECSYVTGLGYAHWDERNKNWTKENCTSVTHNYILSKKDIWTIKPISVSALGQRSNFYAEASSNGFVLDPFFKITAWAPDTTQFNCVSFLSSVENINGKFPIDQVSLFVVENNKFIPVDQQNEATGVLYRSPLPRNKGERRDLQVIATKGYQTVKSNILTYSAPDKLKTLPEIVVFGKNSSKNIVEIYTKIGQETFSGIFPNVGKPTDIALGKFSGEGANADFVFLVTERGKGSIFVQNYAGLKNTLSWIKTAEQAKLYWPYYDLDDLSQQYTDYYGWKAVATSKNIKSSDGTKTGNIVVLGNVGDLDLYNYANGQITQIERGLDLRDYDYNAWRDVTTADVDKDGEDEIILLLSAKDKLTLGDLFIFKYKDYKNLDMKEKFNCKDNSKYNASDPCWVNIDDSPAWIAVAAGQMDSNEDDTEIVALGTPGDLVIMHYNPSIKGIKITGYQWKQDWPDGVEWRDLDTIDYDNDGVKELLFLYKTKNNDYKAAIISLNDALNVKKDDISDFESKAKRVINLDSKVDWQAVAVEDVACL
jgi:hypothetical protein